MRPPFLSFNAHGTGLDLGKVVLACLIPSCFHRLTALSAPRPIPYTTGSPPPFRLVNPTECDLE